MFVISLLTEAEWGPDSMTPMFVVADHDRAVAQMARLTREAATKAALIRARTQAILDWLEIHPYPTSPYQKPVFDKSRMHDKAYVRQHELNCQRVREQDKAFADSPVVQAWIAANAACKDAAARIDQVSEEEITRQIEDYTWYAMSPVEVL